MPFEHKTARVALIVDDFLVESAGIPRYCSRLLSGLRAQGIDVQSIRTRAPRIPYGAAFNHVFTLTTCILRRMGQFDVIHATCPITALSFPFIKQAKVVTYHDSYSILGKHSDVRPHARLLLPLVYRAVAAYSDRVIAHSTQTKEELVRHLHVADEKIAVINSGIEERFRPLGTNGKKQRYVVGYLGASSSSRKRVDYLIAAFCHLQRMHPELRVKLLVCGNQGSEIGELQALTDRLGLLQGVEFSGFVPDEKLVETYNSFDVFVLPSEWEGFGFPILEAQRCGVPVIIREDAHIPAEVSRYCLKATSEEDTADKIYELLTNVKLKQVVIERGLEYSQQFTWERTVRRTMEVYEQVLADR